MDAHYSTRNPTPVKIERDSRSYNTFKIFHCSLFIFRGGVLSGETGSLSLELVRLALLTIQYVRPRNSEEYPRDLPLLPAKAIQVGCPSFWRNEFWRRWRWRSALDGCERRASKGNTYVRCCTYTYGVRAVFP